MPTETTTTTALQPGDLLKEAEVAAMLGVPLQTLRNWRWKEQGPRWRRIGARMVRYHRADLDAFINGGAEA